MWTHYICESCWAKRCEEQGTPGRTPVRLKEHPERQCCFCAAPSQSGIYVRQDPKSPQLVCSSFHVEDDD